jgi:IS5 family transposase
VAALVDWTELERLLTGLSASAKGELGWPPVALFRALLLAMWHDLSDVRLAEALDDRASFRRFCGFAASEPTPERTAFVRFRAELVRRGLDRALFEAITRQLDARGVVIRTGTLVDATLIPSASIRHDHEARWAGHRRRKPTHGYKAHVAEVRRVRARIEKIFGTTKRSYGLRRMRWLGLAKAGLQVRLTAIAYNLRRSWRLLSVAAT